MHQGYPAETLVWFLKARAWNVPKAHRMLIDCINWRMENKIDTILMRPIAPAELYKAVRDSQLLGLSGYSKEGLGVGKSTYDKSMVDHYVCEHRNNDGIYVSTNNIRITYKFTEENEIRVTLHKYDAYYTRSLRARPRLAVGE
ncbi:hypothetical protein MKW92_046131 [Papaver armeniacum]|nr:hypothetical protein MKW92_046131 [Papaver armeniacum]